MTKTRKRGLYKATLLSLVLALLTPTSVSLAEPPLLPGPTPLQQALGEKYAEARQVQAEIRALDKELEVAIEAFNWAREQLNKTEGDLTQTRHKLDLAKDEFETQKEVFHTRITNIYKYGDTDPLELLLNTKDFGDFIARVHFLTSISKQDAEIVEKLKNQKTRIASQEEKLEKLKQEQLEVQQQLEAKRTEIEQKLVERALLLANIDTDIRTIIEQETQLRNVQQRELLEQILRDARSLGIDASPGTVVHTSLKYIGVPYVYGGATPAGFDCSGYTMYVMAQHGVILPHYSRAQYAMGTPVPVDQLRGGDLVFFDTSFRPGISHVGIYVGGGYFIHAPHTGDFVRLARLSARGDYVGARRYPAKRLY